MNNLIIQLIINLIILILGINLGAIFTINVQTFFEQRHQKKQEEIEKALAKGEVQNER